MGNKKNNRKCIICGKEYSYCPACGKDMKKPSWYTIFCGDNCNGIYEIVTTYRDGGCTIEVARELLNNLDLSMIDNEEFNATTRNQIKTILKVEEVVEEESETVDETFETVVEKEPVVDKKSETNNENKNYGNNNKHFYKNNKK